MGLCDLRNRNTHPDIDVMLTTFIEEE